MRRPSHIVLAVMAATLLLAGCSRAKVIPRKTFSQIYADMLLADQWVKDNPSYRRSLDTSLVYERIFESYGYTTDDYKKSVAHYMNDTERYGRMLKKAGDILGEKSARLKREDEAEKLHDERLKVIGERRKAMFLKFSPDSAWKGGAVAAVDSNLEIFLVRRPCDTIYDGPAFTIDTVAVDSVAIDSLVVDSLEVIKPLITSKE